MYAATTSVALVGGDVIPIEVQVHVGRQKEAFKLSGLADSAVREAKDRVRAALPSSGIRFPNRTVTINLAPASTPKGGSDYDLAIAIGVLAAAGEIPRPRPFVVVGELALDGTVRSVPSALGAAVLSARMGIPCLVGKRSAAAVAAVPGSEVYGVGSLAEAVEVLRNGLGTPAVPTETATANGSVHDLVDVKGQHQARAAIEIAAAGRHHLLLHGPPGGGKTMLARRLGGIRPQLTDEEVVEVALIHAASGRDRGLIRTPPFQAPHHTASRAALVGGGSGVVVPGSVSLAHRGILFLDEMAEFPRTNLDTLRQPLEDGEVTVARRGITATLPARFQLVAATNPCPCGFLGDRRKPCECRPSAVARYRQRVSGPLLDRFDLVVKVDRLNADALEANSESSFEVRERVTRAAKRLADDAPIISDRAVDQLRHALTLGLLTARGVARVKSVATTLAALADDPEVDEDHLGGAMAMRGEW